MFYCCCTQVGQAQLQRGWGAVMCGCVVELQHRPQRGISACRWVPAASAVTPSSNRRGHRTPWWATESCSARSVCPPCTQTAPSRKAARARASPAQPTAAARPASSSAARTAWTKHVQPAPPTHFPVRSVPRNTARAVAGRRCCRLPSCPALCEALQRCASSSDRRSATVPRSHAGLGNCIQPFACEP